MSVEFPENPLKESLRFLVFVLGERVGGIESPVVGNLVHITLVEIVIEPEVIGLGFVDQVKVLVIDAEIVYITFLSIHKCIIFKSLPAFSAFRIVSRVPLESAVGKAMTASA